MPGANPKTSLADQFGFTTNANIENPDVNGNSFQYGGQAGGAAARGNQLATLGNQGANYQNYAQNYYSGAQNSALGMMKDQAMGNDYGVAENQLKQGQANAAQEAFSQAASARGGGSNLAAAQGQAMQTNAAGQAGANMQAAQLRSQLQNQGVQNYGQYAQGLSAQQNQANQFNASLQQGYQQQINDVNSQQLQAQMAQQQLQSQNQLAEQQQALQEGEFNAQQSQSATGSLLGAAGSAAGAVGSLFSSDPDAKTNLLGQSGGGYGSMPGTGRGSVGIGQAELANRDATIANFSKEPVGIQTWQNVSMAKPWSPESTAAQSNANKFFFTSDTRAKKEQVKRDALKEQADSLQQAMAGHRDGFEWMNDGPTAVGTNRSPSEFTEVFDPQGKPWMGQDGRMHDVMRGEPREPNTDGYPRPEKPSSNPVDHAMDAFRPHTYEYDERVAPQQAAEMPGQQVGILTKDAKHAPNGQSLVRQSPGDFEKIHIPTAVSTTMAGLGRMNERDKDNRARIDDHDARLDALEQTAQPTPGAKPAGEVNLNPKLAKDEPAVYSAYDNNTKLADLTSSKDAKKEVAPESEHVQPERPEARPVGKDDFEDSNLRAPKGGVPDVVSGEDKRQSPYDLRGSELAAASVDPRAHGGYASEKLRREGEENQSIARAGQEDAWDEYYKAHPDELDPRNFGYSSMGEYLDSHKNPTEVDKSVRQVAPAQPSDMSAEFGKKMGGLSKSFASAGEGFEPTSTLASTDEFHYQPVIRYGMLTSDEQAKKAVYSQGMRDGLQKAYGGNVSYHPDLGPDGPAAPSNAPTGLDLNKMRNLAAPGYNVPAVQTPEQHEAIMKAIGFEQAHPEIGTQELQRHIDSIMAASPQHVRDYAAGTYPMSEGEKMLYHEQLDRDKAAQSTPALQDAYGTEEAHEEPAVAPRIKGYAPRSRAMTAR